MISFDGLIHRVNKIKNHKVKNYKVSSIEFIGVNKTVKIHKANN